MVYGSRDGLGGSCSPWVPRLLFAFGLVGPGLWYSTLAEQHLLSV